jgi:hypothetical protein
MAVVCRSPLSSHEITNMKKPISKFAAGVQTPVFPKTLHQFRPVPKPTVSAKRPKRENTFSKSRDLREDRGTREMKTSRNDQTFHAR